jgi:hypothetical protein
LRSSTFQRLYKDRKPRLQQPVYPEIASPSGSSLISDNLFLPSDC